MSRPPIWQLVRQAIDHFGREVSYAELKQFVWDQYPDVKDSTLSCQIIICAVNHPSRIHYPENRRPRLCTSQYDFLFHTGRGRVAPFDPARHGQWEIVKKDDGALTVRLVDDAINPPDEETDRGDRAGLFALESHLRDYLARNLSTVTDCGPLTLYESADGREGVEFQTDVGPIDLLAVNEQGEFFVFELKLGRGPDAALGQILRYMGWVSEHLANGKPVRGVIVAADISKKLCYAVTQTPQVSLMEYELRCVVKPVQPRSVGS